MFIIFKSNILFIVSQLFLSFYFIFYILYFIFYILYCILYTLYFLYTSNTKS